MLSLAANALSNAQIARALHLREATVKRHMHKVFVKLGAVSRIDAVSIAIARAVLSRPEFLVLDEATSSLDNATESIITDNLRELGCAIVVIAHRLASVVDADVTYVLRHGEIVDTGRHDELIHRAGVYQSLFASQAELAA